MKFALLKIWAILLLLLSLTVSALGYAPQYADEARSVRLRWKTGVIPVSISSSLLRQNLNIKQGSDVSGAIERSLKAWETAANIEFQVTGSEKQTVSPAGKAGDGMSLITIAQTSENLILFGGEADEIAARTRIFFNSRGLITEADIVLNPYAQFSTDGSLGTFDLEATLIHEIGHLLGLEHSSIVGATMHAHQGKNGIYNLPNFNPRTLAEDDFSGIRALYGAKSSNENCCAELNGKLTLPNNKAAADFHVWAEEIETGRIAAGVLTDAEGKFLIEGLAEGNYRIFAQDFASRTFAAEELGKIEALKGKDLTVNKKLKLVENNFALQFAGFNGQISELTVPVNAGKSYTIYLAGKNLDAEKLVFGFNSPNLFVASHTITKHDYGTEMSVISLEVHVRENTPQGEYSIFAQSGNGTKSFLVGSLSVEEMENPWYSRNF